MFNLFTAHSLLNGVAYTKVTNITQFVTVKLIVCDSVPTGNSVRSRCYATSPWATQANAIPLTAHYLIKLDRVVIPLNLDAISAAVLDFIVLDDIVFR